jgi:hypothetical protein
MPVTLSYDLRTDNGNHRNYVRSMLERFGWKRLGGSVFRYPAPDEEEDWLNEVVPSLMFFRSYILRHGIELRFMTLDTNSVVHLDYSDPAATVGSVPMSGDDLLLKEPTNVQSSEERIRRFVTSAVDVLPAANAGP